MGRGDTFHYYAYASDDTTTYGIKLSDAVAAQGGFTTVVDPASIKIWPFHAKNMRHVYGVGPAKQRTKLPCQTVGFTLYTSGGTFSLGGVTYTVEGCIGERRKYNSVS